MDPTPGAVEGAVGLIHKLADSPLAQRMPWDMTNESDQKEVVVTLLAFSRAKPEHWTTDQVFRNKVVPWVRRGCIPIDPDTGYLPSPLRNCENAR